MSLTITGTASAGDPHRQVQEGTLSARGSGTVEMTRLDGVVWGWVHYGTITVTRTVNRVRISGYESRMRIRPGVFRYKGRHMSLYITGPTRLLRLVARRTDFNVSGEGLIRTVGTGTFQLDEGELEPWTSEVVDL